MILTQLPKKYKLTSVHVCVCVCMHSSVCVEAMIEQWKRNRDIRSMSCIRIDSHYCSIIRTKTSVIPNPFKPIVDECVCVEEFANKCGNKANKTASTIPPYICTYTTRQRPYETDMDTAAVGSDIRDI